MPTKVQCVIWVPYGKGQLINWFAGINIFLLKGDLAKTSKRRLTNIYFDKYLKEGDKPIYME